MHKESERICLCPLEGVIHRLSKKWAMLVISTIGNHGSIRFNELMEHHNGLSPKTLADLLKDLQEQGLIRRESFNEVPPRVEYSLTEEGNRLRIALLPLLEWADNSKISGPCPTGNRHKKEKT
jgi:DNA-binding HxlR family transcriptional regulator